jgi:hypothetical protein
LTFAPHQGDDSPAPPSHRLHRLELEITTGEEPLARSVIDRLSRLHHAALESLLEQLFSELSPPGRWDRLESLELDLGTLQASDLEQQLPQRLEQAARSGDLEACLRYSEQLEALQQWASGGRARPA